MPENMPFPARNHWCFWRDDGVIFGGLIIS
jgi:hypothetical protein